MIKAVLDTNIFVSSIFWEKGNPHRIIEKCLNKEVIVFTTLSILKELENVLRRDFEEPEEIVNRQISLVLEYAIVVQPAVQLTVVREDPGDNKIIECAVSCGADYVVTGDRHLLDLEAYGKIKIVTARKFLEIVGGQL